MRRGPNRTTHGWVMTSYWFSRCQPRWRNTTSDFVFGDFALSRRSKSICTSNFVDYINPRLRYNYYFPFGKNKRPPYWNYSSGLDFDHITVSSISFCIGIPNFIQIGQTAAELWCHIDFQDGGRSGAILLPVSDCVTSLSWVGQPSIKFRQDNSIHGWDISTYDFEKQISAILEFFLFWFRQYHCHRHFIMHRTTYFIQIGPLLG